MTKVCPEDFNTHPSYFQKRKLEEKIEKSCQLLSEQYSIRDDKQSEEEALNNITLARTDAITKYNHFQQLCQMQKRWKELMEYIGKSEVRPNIARIIEG